MNTNRSQYEEDEFEWRDETDLEPVFTLPAKIAMAIGLVVGLLYVTPFTLVSHFPFAANENDMPYHVMAGTQFLPFWASTTHMEGKKGPCWVDPAQIAINQGQWVEVRHTRAIIGAPKTEVCLYSQS